MKKTYRKIQWYYNYNMYKLECSFYLEDDVIVDSCFIDLDNWDFIDVRIFWLTPFDVLNDPIFIVEHDHKSIEYDE